jgi:hypothetical protein
VRKKACPIKSHAEPLILGLHNHNVLMSARRAADDFD